MPCSLQASESSDIRELFIQLYVAFSNFHVLHDQTNDPNVARYDKKTILNCQIPALKIHENPTCRPKILILPI
jgi:hypothetical protein